MERGKQMALIKCGFIPELDLHVTGYKAMSGGQEVVLLTNADFKNMYHVIENIKGPLERKYIIHAVSPVPVIECIIRDSDGHTGDAIASATPESLVTDVSRKFPCEMAAKRAFVRSMSDYLWLDDNVYTTDEVPDAVTLSSLDDEAAEAEGCTAEDSAVQSVEETAAPDEPDTAAADAEVPSDDGEPYFDIQEAEPKKQPDAEKKETAPAPSAVKDAKKAKTIEEMAAEAKKFGEQYQEGPGSMKVTIGKYALNEHLDLTVAETWYLDKMLTENPRPEKERIDKISFISWCKTRAPFSESGKASQQAAIKEFDMLMKK